MGRGGVGVGEILGGGGIEKISTRRGTPKIVLPGKGGGGGA